MSAKSVDVYEVLKEENLEAFFLPFQNQLHVNKIQDLKNVSKSDLSRIGIVAGPDLKRFSKIIEKISKPSGIKDIWHKVFKSKHKEVTLPVTSAVLQTEPVIIKITDVDVGKELGKGQFGTVNEGTWKRKVGGQIIEIPVAIKSLGGNLGLNEVSNLTALDQTHDNIIKFFGIIVSGDSPFKMVTEFAPLGSLLSRLTSGDINSISMLSQFAVQIASGMLYLESKHLVHRDLAVRNILVMAYNQVKVSDFGLSKLLNSDKEWIMEEEEILPIRWLAPECLLEGKFTMASDVWSYGVTLWEMFTFGQLPWENLGSKETIEKITGGITLAEPTYCPRYIYPYILKKCWQFRPEDRFNFQQIQEQMTSLQPTTAVASITQQKPDFLEFQQNDMITAIKPIGLSADLWFGQNEATGNIGKFRKSATHPLSGKVFENALDEAFIKSKEESALKAMEQERRSSDSEYSSLERKRAQSHGAHGDVKRRDRLEPEVPQQRPLSDGLLLEKLQDLIETGHYDLPRPLFDDEDDYVTMKEFFREDSIAVTSTKEQPTISKTASDAGDSNLGKSKEKPIPPPKPKRTFGGSSGDSPDKNPKIALHNEALHVSSETVFREKSSKDSTISVLDTLPLQVQGSTTNKDVAVKSAHVNGSTVDIGQEKEVIKSIRKHSKSYNPLATAEKSQENGADVKEPTQHEVSQLIHKMSELEARSKSNIPNNNKSEIVERKAPKPPRKPQRTFSKPGVDAMMSELQVVDRVGHKKDASESDNTFMKRVSPHSTLKLEGQLNIDFEQGTEKDSPKDNTSHLIQTNGKGVGDDMGRLETNERSSGDSSDEYTNVWEAESGYSEPSNPAGAANSPSEVADYPQESGKYDMPRLYEANKNLEENIRHEIISPPVIKPRLTTLDESKGAHKTSALEERHAQGEDVFDTQQGMVSNNHKPPLQQRYSNPVRSLRDRGSASREELVHTPDSKNLLKVNEPSQMPRGKWRSVESIPDQVEKASGAPKYQSYTAISKGPMDSTKKDGSGTHSRLGVMNSRRSRSSKLSRSTSDEDAAVNSWDPTERSGSSASNVKGSKQVTKTPKKKSRKSNEFDNSRQGPIITLEQVPKFLKWIHQSYPELSSTTHSELCGALELTKGSIDEAIRYLKYRRVLECGAPITADMALDALEQCNWDTLASIKTATLMYVVYQIPNVNVDHCRQLLMDCNWNPERVIRKLTIDSFVRECEEIGVMEEQARLALKHSKGDTTKAIHVLKARRVSEIVGKSEEHCRQILSHCEWDTDKAINFILLSP